MDNVLSGRPMPGWIAAVTSPIGRRTRARCLAPSWRGGLVLQMTNEAVSMVHTQIMVDTGQRMVYDLRARLFAHLQALDCGTTLVSAGDAVYRIDADAYCIDNLVMRGIFPLGSAALTLVVMLAILIKLDSTLALLALCVVPFLYWVLRVYTTPLGDRAERVKELESTLAERLYEKFAAIRVVKSFARERYEQERFGARSMEAMRERMRLTWQESLFSVAITGVTMIGTALVLLVGGLHVLRGELTVGSLLVVIAYLGSVYGPLSAIAHTTGSLQEALASTRRVREMLAHGPGRHRRAERSRLQPGPRQRRHRVRARDVRLRRHAPVLHDISFEAQAGRDGRARRPDRRRQDDAVSLIPRFYDPTAGRVLIDGVRRARVPPAVAARAHRDRAAGSGAVSRHRSPTTSATAGSTRPTRRSSARRVAAHAHEFICRLPNGYDTRDRRSRRRPVGRRAPAPQRRAGAS